MTNTTSHITKKRTLIGTVVSDKMNKTRVVAVKRMAHNSQYNAQYKTTTRYKAHDEQNVYQIGDEVVIQETRPRSRDKRWDIVELIKKGEKRGIDTNNSQDETKETELE
jgi:small subunit ribosomal protein S17